jgi:hypothetical protein
LPIVKIKLITTLFLDRFLNGFYIAEEAFRVEVNERTSGVIKDGQRTK